MNEYINRSEFLRPLPEIAEPDATGQVAQVFDEIRNHVSFVPGLFRSLALAPDYLALAWEQAAPHLSAPDFLASATTLADTVSSAVTPPAALPAREILRQYASGRMLLLSTALETTLGSQSEGSRQLDYHTNLAARANRSTVFSPTHPTFQHLRIALKSPLINTVWRHLYRKDLLDATWTELGPQIHIAHRGAPEIEARASAAARSLTWPLAPSAGMDGMDDRSSFLYAQQIVTLYRYTLSRVLVLVASSR